MSNLLLLLISVFFRVRPWQMLLLLLLLLLLLPSVKFRVNPWLCLFLIPSLTHPALKNMLLLFPLNLAFTLVYDNAHDEWAYPALRIFARSWLGGHPPENLGYLRPKVRQLKMEVFLQREQLFPESTLRHRLRY